MNAGPVAEQVLLLENIGTSVLVGPEQLTSLHKLLLTAASTLQMDPPDLYIKQVPVSACRLDTFCHSIWQHMALLTIAEVVMLELSSTASKN